MTCCGRAKSKVLGVHLGSRVKLAVLGEIDSVRAMVVVLQGQGSVCRIYLGCFQVRPMSDVHVKVAMQLNKRAGECIVASILI